MNAGPKLHAAPVEVRHYDVFASQPGGGNPCPIVLDADGLTAGQMRAIAAHYGQETGFVLQGEPLRLRFFVPRHEMAMCVHATVAVLTALVQTGWIATGKARIVTASGTCRVDIGPAETGPTETGPTERGPAAGGSATGPEIGVEQQPPRLGPPLRASDRIATALGLPVGAIDPQRRVQVVSVSRPKLIVPLREAADVQAIRIDPALLWPLCRELDTTGAYPFAPARPGNARELVARQFPVDAGYPEDPATGVAAGALAAYLFAERSIAAVGDRGAAAVEISIEQGGAMGRPSVLRAAAVRDSATLCRTTVLGRATARSVERIDAVDLPGAFEPTPELR